MAESPATLLVVSHDRRLLETVCERLWVVDDGVGGRRSTAGTGRGGRPWPAAGRWRAPSRPRRRGCVGGRRRPIGRATAAPYGAAPNGRRPVARPPAPPAAASGRHRPRTRAKKEKLSKDAYRRQKAALEAELTRLGLRKNHLELAMGDPACPANFVELRRVTSELADVDAALAAAEDAWLELEERAP